MAKVKTARESLLNLILIGFAISFLFLVIQTATGFLGDFKVYVWLWFLILYLPPILLLFLTKNKSFETNIRGLKILSALFVSAIVGVIILDALIGLEDIQVIKTSTYFLIPLEILLVYLIWYKKGDLPPLPPCVFISYNHNDVDVALKIKEAIEAAKIDVIIDTENMEAGTDIKTFIQTSLKVATVTVSLISNSSLESAWVGMETVDTLFLQAYLDHKKFIACYLDNDFFQNDYTIKKVTKIEIKIKELELLILQSHQKDINTRDLDSKLIRTRNLKNNMDGIIARLQNSLCIDVGPNEFNSSMKKLLKAIQTEQ
ncbi:toll/interleukin-1 receptor domain-containing protein [Aequorivita capsosiphonis]|uniref:toll/interleukin-1 receptor domain-containing protein n=1 Tax=Aequorivita capsosiphonis TaxID=487317 RepID=UPI0004173BE1|nr:toll/interleukin-1 receptor domain-containing protein [Aequorivita capsosiphonis]